MMCPWNILHGYVFYQFLFDFVRGVGMFAYQTQTVADTEYVGVDSHRALAEGYTLYHIGGLATYSWQIQQVVHV